ncbi:MAG TPA: tetratricopeptide repeat protein [Polyangiaceae bacterium]|jgi:tetratricopeptide (TPR) repeat protein|nr:tetratricopeptide repeat protein [Polyangiaceae bacterium]
MRRRLGPAVIAGFVAAGCAGHAASTDRAQQATPAGTATISVTPTGSAMDRAFADYDASRYAAAEQSFRAMLSPSEPRARLGLVQVLLITGRYALAASTAEDTVGAPPNVALELVRIRGEAFRRQGKLAEAEKILASAAGDPAARAVRLLLGEVMLEQGRKKDAEPVLMTLIDEYNKDAVSPKDGATLALVGRAAQLLGSVPDANDAFNEAERAGPVDVDTLLWRADLFLENYDPGHAEEVLSDILAKAPRHPDALARMAEVRLAQNLDFEAAEKLANDALAVNPSLTLSSFVIGGVALRDMDIAKADGAVQKGLAVDPRDLSLLSLGAAIRFLADDRPGFEQAKRSVLSLNPRYSRLYQIVGEYAEWEHRYDEIVTMMTEALLADSEDAKVRAQLGFNLIRAGHEADGVSALRRAFSADPFNARVLNTLNLYEKEIPKGYETVDHGKFVLRYSHGEKELLDRYIPAMLARAWDKMTKEYGFVPQTPVGIELYPVREHFAIRTSGLPQTFIQGVCFGHTLAAMSPKDEHFNIGMTLWHELAHVFHIQLSKAHVPRWFTEGLAEYETLIERPEWRREYDSDLYESLQRGGLPSVADMNRSFSHAEDMQDMATAYYASTQVVAFIVERYGWPKVRRMLELWGGGKTTKDVLLTALGASPADIDRDFRAALTTRLARYRGQFMPPNRPRDVKTAETIANAAPADAEKQAELALAWMGAGEEKKAKVSIDRALSLDPKLGLALWLRLQLAKTGNDRAAAKRGAEALIAAGHDGYAVRVALAEASPKDEQRAALEAAHEFDPLESAPLRRLAELAREAKDFDGEVKALRALVVLEENDGDSYRRLLSLLVGRHELEEARRIGEAAVYVDAESAETHRLYGEALLAAGQRKEAEFEFSSAVLGQGEPAELSLSHARLADLLDAAGDKAGAATHRKTAADLIRSARTGPI